MNVAELYVGVRDGKEREVLDQLIGLLRVVEITTKIAQQTGLWLRKYGRSHGAGIMDALIAACADSLRTPFHLNLKHFPMLTEIWAPITNRLGIFLQTSRRSSADFDHFRSTVG